MVQNMVWKGKRKNMLLKKEIKTHRNCHVESSRQKNVLNNSLKRKKEHMD